MNQPQSDHDAQLAADRRAQFVADLRALAALIELQVQLPLPFSMSGVAYVQHSSPQVKVAAVFQMAQILGTPVTFDDQRGVCETALTSGRVSYGVYASIPKPPRTGHLATVHEPAEVLRALGINPSPSQVLSTAKTALGEA